MIYENGKVILYGLDNISSKVDNVIENLNLKKEYFEIRLVIFEAVNNAFIHGNKKDKSKPIHLKWKLKNNFLTICVKDCGTGFENLSIDEKINEDDILEESGRGLQIIKSYTNEVKFKKNTIIMKKYIC